MRQLMIPFLAVGVVLGNIPLVASHGDEHAGEHLDLYGILLNPTDRSAELVPYKPTGAWQSPGLCSYPDNLLVPPAASQNCQELVYVLKNATRVPLTLPKDAITIQFFLSADVLLLPCLTVAPCPSADAGAAPQTTVEARLSFGATEIGKQSVTKDVMTNPDGKPTAFPFSLEPQVMEIPAGAKLELAFRWWQADAAGNHASVPLWNVHYGGEYDTVLSLPVMVPPLGIEYDAELIEMANFCPKVSEEPSVVQGALLKKSCKDVKTRGSVLAIQATINSTFQRPPVDAKDFQLEFQGPGQAKNVFGPFEAEVNGTLYFGYVWDYVADDAQPTQYSVSASMKDEFVGPAGNAFELSLSSLDALESENTIPALPAIATIGMIAAALFAARRRRRYG